MLSRILLLIALAAMPAVSVAYGQTREEAVLWKSIENSQNPDDYRGYLDKYPNGVFAPVAQRRLATLAKAAQEKIGDSRWEGRGDYHENGNRFSGDYSHRQEDPSVQDHRHHSYAIKLTFAKDGTCSNGTSQACTWNQHGLLVTVKLAEDTTKKYCPMEYTLTLSGTDMSGIANRQGKGQCILGEDRLTLKRVD